MNPKKLLLLFAIFLFASCQTPEPFSWDNVNGTSFITEVHSQNYPYPCNSGWAFAAIDVFNSRIKIKRKAASP